MQPRTSSKEWLAIALENTDDSRRAAVVTARLLGAPDIDMFLELANKNNRARIFPREEYLNFCQAIAGATEALSKGRSFRKEADGGRPGPGVSRNSTFYTSAWYVYTAGNQVSWLVYRGRIVKPHRRHR